MDNQKDFAPELKRSVSFDEYRDDVYSINQDNTKMTVLKDKTGENKKKVDIMEDIYSNPFFFQ